MLCSTAVRIYPGGFAKELVRLLPKILRNPPKLKVDVPWWLPFDFHDECMGGSTGVSLEEVSLNPPFNGDGRELFRPQRGVFSGGWFTHLFWMFFRGFVRGLTGFHGSMGVSLEEVVPLVSVAFLAQPL